MATWPTCKIEIAFVSDPFDDTPTWVDVSADVRENPGVQITRGTVGALGQPITAGQASFLLSNRARLYDPANAAGTYFGQLKARKQVRITATWAAVDYTLFRGFVSGFNVTTDNGGKDSVVSVVAFDLLSIMAATRLSGGSLGAYGEYVAALSPTMWLRTVSTTAWSDYNDTYTVVPPLASLGQVFTPVASLAVGVTGSNGYATGTGGIVPVVSPAITDASDWSLSFWWQSSMTLPTTTKPIMSATGGATYVLGITSGGFLSWVSATSGANRTSVVGAVSLLDGLVHHVLITRAGTTITMYVDGVADTGAVRTPTGSGDDTFALGLIGGSFGVTSTTLQDVAVFATCLSAADADTLNALGRGIATETTAERMDRLATVAGVPAAWRDMTTEPVAEVSELTYTGQSALAAMQQVERGEQGRLFVSADGLLTFAYRWAAYAAASTITLSDDGAGQAYSGAIQIRQSDQDMLNDVTVSNATTSVQYIDTASVTADGPYASSIDTNLSTLAQMSSMAFGLVGERKSQTTRMEPILLGYPSSWPTVLSLELNQKMTVEHTPMGVGSQASYTVIISQIAWSITGASGWRCTLAGAPMPAVTYWMLGTSTLGTDTYLGY